MCKCKSGIFVVYHLFTIKTKKIQHIILETFTKKKALRNLTRFPQQTHDVVSTSIRRLRRRIYVLQTLKRRRVSTGSYQLSWIYQKFSQQLFVKNDCLNLNLSQMLQSPLLKNEKISSQKRCKPPKNCLIQQEREEKH